MVIFGKSAGENIVNKIKDSDKNINLEIDSTDFQNKIEYYLSLLDDNGHNEKSNVGEIRTEMQEIMQKYASVYKDEELKETGFQKISELLRLKIKINDKSEIWNTDLIEGLELRNMLDLVYVTAFSSIFREESRGSHFRIDYPERNDDKWLFHTLSYLKDRNITNKKFKVVMDSLYPEEMASVPLAKRTY